MTSKYCDKRNRYLRIGKGNHISIRSTSSIPPDRCTLLHFAGGDNITKSDIDEIIKFLNLVKDDLR